MKKILAILFIILIVGACALAEQEYIREMRVVNCDEWVSLRAYADTKSERVAAVPLNAVVEECFARGDFYYCSYEGHTGYILADIW